MIKSESVKGIIAELVGKDKVLAAPKEFIILCHEYDQIVEAGQNKMTEIITFVREHPKEFGMITNIGDSDAEKEGTKKIDN